MITICLKFHVWCGRLGCLVSLLVIYLDLRNLNFEASLKIPWCFVRDFDGLEILVTTARVELQTSYFQCSYLTHYAIRPNMFGGLGEPEFATLQQE